MAENSLLIEGKGSLGAVSLPMERMDVCLLPPAPAADPHESLLPGRLRRYDDLGARGGLTAWMSLNSGSSSCSIARCCRSPLPCSKTTTARLLLLLPLVALCALNMWHLRPDRTNLDQPLMR
jgi:hypothetical protein